MKAPNVTKGDWRVIRKPAAVGYASYEIAWSDDGELVCDIVYEESDAKMLAAAPMLAEALHEAYERYLCSCNFTGCLHCAYSRKVEAALKAAGYTED